MRRNGFLGLLLLWIFWQTVLPVTRAIICPARQPIAGVKDLCSTPKHHARRAPEPFLNEKLRRMAVTLFDYLEFPHDPTRTR
jgi:hypothetical protein